MYRNKHKLSLNLTVHPDSDKELGVTGLGSEKVVPIKHGKLCLPNDPTNIAFVQKKGKKTILYEIKIYKLIASNKQSKKKAILQAIPNVSNEPSLLLPFM